MTSITLEIHLVYWIKKYEVDSDNNINELLLGMTRELLHYNKKILREVINVKEKIIKMSK